MMIFGFVYGNPRIFELFPIPWCSMELGLDSFGNLTRFLCPYLVVLCIVIECLRVCVVVRIIYGLNTLTRK